MAEVDELRDESCPRVELLAAEDAHRIGATQDRREAIFLLGARERSVPALGKTRKRSVSFGMSDEWILKEVI